MIKLFNIFKSDRIKKYNNSADIIELLIKSLNIKIENKEIDKKEKSVNYELKYQNGTFNIIAFQTKTTLIIRYLYFFDTDLDNIRIVSQIINQFNIGLLYSRIVYNYTEKDNKINVHIITNINISDNSEKTSQKLSQILMNHFSMHRDFIDEYEKAVKESNKKSVDPEYDKYRSIRDNVLLRESEVKHSELSIGNLHFDKDNHFTIKYILQQLFEITEFADIQKVNLYSDKQVDIITDIKTIDQLDIFKLIFQDNVPHDDIVITINIKTEKIIINIQYKEQINNVFYFRMIAFSDHNDNALETQQFTINLAYTQISDREKQAEFTYLWQDAQDKINNEKYNELSDEQRLISRISNRSLAHDIYWGTKRFYEKRYFEAIRYFQDPYKYYQSKYPMQNKKNDNIFYEISYMLGFCYMELKLYQQAYYYLDGLHTLGQFKYTTEYINCLCNSNDYRAIGTINNLLQLTVNELNKSEIDDDDNNTEEENRIKVLKRLNQFLIRRKVFVLINIHQYDEAEEILNKMLDDPENKDFAINELAYLKHIKNDEENNNKT